MMTSLFEQFQSLVNAYGRAANAHNAEQEHRLRLEILDYFAATYEPASQSPPVGDSELVTRLRLIGESYREREKTAKRATERLLCQLRADTCERAAAALAARQQDAGLVERIDNEHKEDDPWMEVHVYVSD